MAEAGPPEPIVNPEVKYTKLFINNEFVNSVSGKTFQPINPTSEEAIAAIQEGDEADIDKAVEAAKNAFKLGSEWRRMDATGRAKLLNKLADLIERDIREISSLETKNMGVPFMVSYFFFTQYAIGNLRYHAGLADKINGETIPVDGDYFCYTRFEPIGVVGAIVPWNCSVAMFAQKVAPAIAAGCTIVLKPAEQTPLTALYIGALVKEAGFPPGVINIVPGYGPTAGAALASHMDVSFLTFTGSTEVGRLIMQASALSNLKKVALELGGKSPAIVLPDADVAEAAKLSHDLVMSNSGQICAAGTRTFVHEDMYDKFIEESVKLAKERTLGDPMQAQTQSGPQTDKATFDKVLSYVASGKEQGAKLQCGGQRQYDKGYFIQPTVFSDVTDDMKIAKDEIFGPVQSVFKYRDISEVIERANDTRYGLAAYVITNDLANAMHVAHSLQAGIIGVNNFNTLSAQAPFGGYKMSGLGREMGLEGIKEYCEIKTVMIKVPQKNF